MEGFPRITIEPDKMGGAPCIRGYRMPVSSILRMMGDGWTTEQILEQWPEFEREDIAECFRYAAEVTAFREVAV